jgi:hypothetical protein
MRLSYIAARSWRGSVISPALDPGTHEGNPSHDPSREKGGASLLLLSLCILAALETETFLHVVNGRLWNKSTTTSYVLDPWKSRSGGVEVRHTAHSPQQFPSCAVSMTESTALPRMSPHRRESRITTAKHVDIRHGQCHTGAVTGEVHD